jgi:large subunit ribosomal protein L21
VVGGPDKSGRGTRQKWSGDPTVEHRGAGADPQRSLGTWGVEASDDWGMDRGVSPHIAFEDRLMFAIIEDGGRQYRVQAGDKLQIDYRCESNDGDAVQFDKILAAGTEKAGKIGQPVIAGAVVEATVLEAEVRGRKIEVGKFRRRKGTIRHNGHTQRYTKIQITGIKVPGFDAVSAPVATASVPAEQS